MKVFVTGASGNIGSALVKELISSGHTVLGLTRSDAGAEKLKTMGAEVLLGALEDSATIAQAAANSDAVAHLAFGNGLADFAGVCAADRTAIIAMGDALVAAGGNKALIITSGTMMTKKGMTTTEQDDYDVDDTFGAIRGASETVALNFAAKGLRAMVMRLPPVVHGAGSLGFVQVMVQIAQQTQKTPYIGDGQNRWCAVHTLDAAKAFRLAIEKGKAGSKFHAVGEAEILVKHIADSLGERLELPVESMDMKEAESILGVFAQAFSADNPSSSTQTRADLGWAPTQKGLIENIKGDALAEAGK